LATRWPTKAATPKPSLTSRGRSTSAPTIPSAGRSLVRGARANLHGGLRQSIRVGAESHSDSKLSLLALCPPGGCAWAHAAGGGTEDCRRRASAAKAGILVRLCAQAALLRQEPPAIERVC